MPREAGGWDESSRGCRDGPETKTGCPEPHRAGALRREPRRSPVPPGASSYRGRELHAAGSVGGAGHRERASHAGQSEEAECRRVQDDRFQVQVQEDAEPAPG